jgi:hypothetical protein
MVAVDELGRTLRLCNRLRRYHVLDALAARPTIMDGTVARIADGLVAAAGS